jgi:hypothetical protein
MPEGPCFLEMEEYHTSKGEAKKIVVKNFLEDGIKSPKGGWERASFVINNQNVTFKELMDSVRASGIMPFTQFKKDRADDIFGGTFGISTPTMAFGQVTSTYAGYTRILTPPMTDQPVESELSEDIMFYREEACLFSDEYDFVFCTRYYRAYLTACISIIDAFINRHILMYKYKGWKTNEIEDLQKTGRLEERVNKFLLMTTGKDISSINGGDEWSHFKKIRALRNEMTHINGPTLGYSIPEFAEHFNYVRKGVGGLLYKIRELQGKTSLSFIEQLKTAPIVYFNEITHKSNGNHIIKRRK